jgi:hypothetical protein
MWENWITDWSNSCTVLNAKSGCTETGKPRLESSVGFAIAAAITTLKTHIGVMRHGAQNANLEKPIGMGFTDLNPGGFSV